MTTIPKQIFVNGEPYGQVWRIPEYENPEQYIMSLLINHSGLIALNNTIHDKKMLLTAMNEVNKLLKAIGVKRMDYGEDSLTANVMIREKLVEHIKPSMTYTVPYTLDNPGSQSKDQKKRMKDLPILIAHAYYMIYSQFGEGDKIEKEEFMASFKDIIDQKYGQDAGEFICKSSRHYKRIKEYYENT